MLELDVEDRLAIARLQSARETGVNARFVREAAILIPCAVIFWFAVVWGDVGAWIVGPALYVAAQVFLSFRDLARDRRIGEILIAYEEERQRRLERERPDRETGVPPAAEGAESASKPRQSTVPPRPGPAPIGFADLVALDDEAEEGEALREEVAGCCERAADETEAARAHYVTAARRFRKGKIPRGCAHLVAALGHLQAADEEVRAAASIHAERSRGGE